MILSGFVKFQLVAFALMSTLAMVVMLFSYMQIQTQLGIGRMTVTLDLPSAGGLYNFGNVTYRGAEVGRVVSVDLTDDGVRASLSIDDSLEISSDLQAQVRSMSAIGEQYVDLRPNTDDGPYLHDGSVITVERSEVPQPVGPMLDELSDLLGSIPKDKLNDLMDELYRGLGGERYELQSLIDTSSTLAGDFAAIGATTRALIEDAEPLINSQVRSADAIEIWSRSLAGVTGQLVTNDPQIRSILASGPGFSNEVTKLLQSVEFTLPVLLANLTSVGQLAVTYNAGLEQLLVLLPPSIAMIQAVQPKNNASGLGLGDFRISGVSDPPACTVGFLPPDQWRPPSDTTTIDTPEGLYCKLPQDSDIAVRGARNIPCLGVPGKRAASAELCNSDEEFVPVAPSQPLLGDYPPDPNLEQQGITSGVATAQYSPTTGTYVGPDGALYQQTDVATSQESPTWQGMLPQS
ncbi:MlaD family protein [Williamsia sp.]|uniref:MlaD family protein n=1 Tax=Williamsia sp. TaxID=1872085 RepID=UPI002F95D1A2